MKDPVFTGEQKVQQYNSILIYIYFVLFVYCIFPKTRSWNGSGNPLALFGSNASRSVHRTGERLPDRAFRPSGRGGLSAGLCVSLGSTLCRERLEVASLSCRAVELWSFQEVVCVEQFT